MGIVAFAAMSMAVGRAGLVRKGWAEYALKAGLNFTGAGYFETPTLYGRIGDRGVHATLEWRGSGKSRHRYTVIKVDVGAKLPPGLTLSREGFGAGFMKLLGEQDIEVGDKRLDDAVLIQGGSPSRVTALLKAPGIRRALLAFFERSPDGRVYDEQVILETSGSLPYGIGGAIQSCVDLADALARGVRVAGGAPALKGSSTALASSTGAAAGTLASASSSAGHPVRAPGLGPPGSVASLARILVQEGELVEVGAPLCEIFTAKGTVEVVSSTAGRVGPFGPRPGDSVKSGALLVHVVPTEPGAQALGSITEAEPLDSFFLTPLTLDDPSLDDSHPVAGPEPELLPRAPVSEPLMSEPLMSEPLMSEPLMSEPHKSDLTPLEPLFSDVPLEALTPIPLIQESAPPMPKPPPAASPPTPLPPLDPAPLDPAPLDPAPLDPAPLDPAPASGAADGIPAIVTSTLADLASGRVPLPKREEAVGALAGQRLSFVLRVDQVRWTSGLFLPAEIQGGRTASGSVVGAELVLQVRFAAARNAEVDALSSGAEVPVSGIVAGWDDLYRRALVDAS
jgi:biotin carboxyl carrier protein